MTKPVLTLNPETSVSPCNLCQASFICTGISVFLCCHFRSTLAASGNLAERSSLGLEKCPDSHEGVSHGWPA